MRTFLLFLFILCTESNILEAMDQKPTIKIGIMNKANHKDLKHNYNDQRAMTVFDCCTAAMLCLLYYSGFARYKMPHSRQ